MIEITRKINFLKIREIYFANNFLQNKNQDIEMYVQAISPRSSKSLPFTTLVVDLSAGEDQLYGALSKSHRYEIKRGMEKDSIECCIYFSPGGGAVKRFIDFYNAFSIFKGVALANAEKLYAFHLAGALIISEVRGNDASTCYAMHCYVTDGVSARLYYSATLPRKNANDAINFDYQLLGRANKLLHWKTMLAMKNHGLNFYDFGGIANTTELKGIDDFKRQFGGLKIVHYNDLVPVSVVGRLALFFYGLIKSLF